jgi:hypothetical protein
LAASVLGAARHVFAWMRRTFARLAAELPALLFVAAPVFGEATTVRVVARARAASARGPPLPD